jgi:hypothetical protein
MKKSGIIFFELVLIILLFACATNTTDIKTYKVTEDGAHVAWDPVPKPSDNREKYEIGYCVYTCKRWPKNPESKIKKEVELATKKSGDKIKTPITETSCTIIIRPTGEEFFIGVQTVVYETGNPVDCNPKKINTKNRSEIAWSDEKIYTNNSPFDAINYGQK